MNFNQEQATISPDFAAGPTTSKPAQTSGSNSNRPSKATKIENPFDIYISASTASPSAAANKSDDDGSTTYANIQQHQQNDGTSDKSWIALMNDGTAALDVFQLLPTTNTTANNNLNDKTTDTPGTYPLPNIATAVTDGSNLQLQKTTSLPIEPTRSSDTLGFDPETYSYDEEMGAIYAESIKKSSMSTRHQNILHKLSEEEDSTYVADESYKNDGSNNPPIISLTSLMASTSHPSSLKEDGVTTPVAPTTQSITRILPQTSEQPKLIAPPPPDIPYLQDPRNYDYSDVAIQSNHQPYIPSSATFDSNVSSIGDIDPQFTTSSDIVRQHIDNNTSTNRNAKMVSLGTGSIVMVETASSSEQTTSNNDNANNDMNDEEEDNELAARIMFVLQGAAALNSGNVITGVKNSGKDQEHQFIPPDQPHTSMTDSQIYVTESEENHQRESSKRTYDEDVDNLPPATIVVPSASSISSPLSQQQQERQHIVLEPFSYASSTDDGDNEVIKGFFGDTDTEDDEPTLLSNLSPNQKQQSYGPIVIPTSSNNDTISQFSGQSQRNIVQNTSNDVSTLNSASYNNSWSNVTPALAMTAAGLGVQTFDNIKILQHPRSSPPLSPQGIEDVHHKMSYQSSPDGADDVKYKMSSMHQPFDSSKSVGNGKGHFPRQDDNQHDEAKIVDAQAEDKSRYNRYWCAMYVGFIFLFVGIVLLIYFLVRNNNEKPMESPSSSPLYPPSTKAPPPPTLSPTLAPSATLPPIFLVRDELFLQLQNVSSDNGTTIVTPDTPQALAFDWLLSDPKIIDYSISKRLTRFALAVFYFSTGGNSSSINVTANSLNSSITQPPVLWFDNYLWLTFEDECLWYTRSRSGLCGISNDTQVPVVQNLDVSYNNLFGTIPPEIGLLSNLQTLSIGGGPDISLTGTIPSELGNLSLLQELRLQYNQLTGRVPASIGRCTFLQAIDLSNNHLRGLIPSDIGMMTNLVVLSLDHNAFQGPIPTTIGQCSSIKTLNLAHNDLAVLPTEVYRLSNLVFLDVQNNTLSGPFESPSEIGGLSNINTILLSNNQLSGSLPIDFNVLSTLKVLDLSYNTFTGTIPELFVKNNVTNATMNDESLPSDGDIFASNDSSAGLYLLRILHLNNNLLTGIVPESFSELSNIQVLSLHSNLFNGTVPTTVCDTFNVTRATVSIDCLEVDCSCCIFCCNMNNGTTTASDPIVSAQQLQFEQPDDGDDVCVCRHWNTTLEWLCY